MVEPSESSKVIALVNDVEQYFAQLREENERLQQQLAEAKEYLIELRGAWSWRKDEPCNRNDERYNQLVSFIQQISEATNQD